MKRFFSLFLVAVILATLVIPVSADDNFYISGKWIFNENVTISEDIDEEVSFVSNNKSCKAFDINSSSGNIHYIVKRADGSEVSSAAYYSGEWINTAWASLDFGVEKQYVSSTFYNWFVANAEQVKCDGTSCPATDVNDDNICDDCGAPFVFNLRNDVYTYNGVVLPQLPEFDVLKYQYYFITTNSTTGSYTLRLSTVPLDYRPTNDSMIFAKSGETLIYDFVEPYWELRMTSNVLEGQTAAQPYTLVHWTNFDLIDQGGTTLISGDPNFMPPLWEKVQQMTQGKVTEAAAAVRGAMGTLTLCGVGLIALLMGLILCGRVFRRYRS